jgi:hypothetical protein
MPVGNFLGHPLSLNGGVELRGIRNDVDGRTTADVMSYGVLSGYPPYNVSSSQEFSDDFCDIGLSLNFAATLGLSERASVSIGGGFETWDIGVPSLVPGEQAKVEREERSSYHIGASLDISF